jgi:hypothetical protein
MDKILVKLFERELSSDLQVEDISGIADPLRLQSRQSVLQGEVSSMLAAEMGGFVQFENRCDIQVGHPE